MIATFCFLVCFSLEELLLLLSRWLLRLHSRSISCTRPLRTRHCSSLLQPNTTETQRDTESLEEAV